MEVPRKLFLRAETYANECRTPLVPQDICILIKKGFTVYVQSSGLRCYTDSEYRAAGAIVTEKEWHDPQFKDCLILGIKELNRLDKLGGHRHVYFSHSFKGQQGADTILQAFKGSKSLLYDLEYLVGDDGKRLIAFGFHAGLVGGALGVLQYCSGLRKLTPWASLNDMIAECSKSIPMGTQVTTAIVGADGRCGRGVQSLLDRLGLTYTKIGRGDMVTSGCDYDIIYNAISLEKTYDKVWFSQDSVFPMRTTIVDISCDYTRPNNPIQLYDEATTWASPVHTVGNVSVIAIENLPSLLPIESSDHFSEGLCRLLLETDEPWSHAVAAFQSTQSN